MLTTPSPNLLVPTPLDLSFHTWCDSLGLAVNPSVHIVTSSLSVGGRGAFAINDLVKGETIARIPSGLVFYPENAKECFPETAAHIQKNKLRAIAAGSEDDLLTKKRFQWIRTLWKKVISKKKEEMKKQTTTDFNFMDVEKTWQPELTLYALAALKEKHPWSEWISQWQRDDPTYHLFLSNAKPHEEEAIKKTADELNNIMPTLQNSHLQAGLSFRLGRLDEERKAFRLNDDSKTSAMYSILGSRVIGCDDLFDGVIPFHDMINHSLRPNISLEFNGEWIEIFTKSNIKSGEELFLCYTNNDERMDEISAMWALIQWGIPTQSSDYVVLEEEEAKE